jgi:hypothetical protein
VPDHRTCGDFKVHALAAAASSLVGASEMSKMSDRDRLLAALPQDGEFVTNREIREKLGLSDDRYWGVRNKLLTDGKLIIGRGYGGRVALKRNAADISKEQKPPTPATAQEEIKEIQEDIKAEASLYEPFAEAIRKISIDDGLEQTIVQVTAWAARKKKLGPWTQPDVCRISVQNLMYLKQKVVELATYEIKPSICDVHGVYEALSHSRRAHRSYLALYAKKSEQADESAARRLERLKIECARTGVGLIVFSDPKNFETYDVLVEPRANFADLSEVNEFIATEITEKDKILKWLM